MLLCVRSFVRHLCIIIIIIIYIIVVVIGPAIASQPATAHIQQCGRAVVCTT